MWRRVTNFVNDTLTSARPRSCVRVTAGTGVNDALDFREMPTPRSLPVVGTTLALLAAGSAPRLHEYVHGRHADLGPVYRETMGPVDAVFVCDPEEMRAVFNHEGKYPKHVLPDAWVLYNQMYKCSRGLFFMDGEEWLHFRRVMNKMLLKTDALSWLRDPCNEVASTIVTRWESLLSGGNSVIIPNLEAEMYRFSIDTLIAVLLGDKYAECKSTLEHDVAYLASVVHLIFQTSAKLYLIPATWAATFKLPAWTRFVRAADDGLNVANTLTKKIMYDCPRGNGLVAKMIKENMDETNIARIVADLILAAGDTTAYSMQWTLYLLAKNIQIQNKLLETVENETLHTHLMKGIMREALRLYPVAPFLTRILPQDTCIGGYMVPNGTLIIMSLYTSGRNCKYFKLPEMFWPERWFRNSSRDYVAASSFASIPFAMGARSCIGRKIAETQMQAALKKITNRFHLELMNEKEVEVILRMVSVPSASLSIKITARN